MKNIIEYFPDKLRNILAEKLKTEGLEEIRVRNGKPIILKFNNKEEVIKYAICSQEILEILQLICENSIYSYQKNISTGFITLHGGHRVGIVGSCVIENDKVININYINSFNFRIARQVIGCADGILEHILDLKNNSILNSLIVSPPGYGKTTILKDVTRQISNGIENKNFKGIDVGIVDERSEIASMYKGIPQNDLGIRTDILENVSKSTGMKMLVRSMAPKVIIADEIGSFEDLEAINYVLASGCKGIFTAHGANFEDISLNPVLKNLLDTHAFEKIIFLSPERGKFNKIYKLDEKESNRYLGNN